MNRWPNGGVLGRVFSRFQHDQIIRLTIEAVALDQTAADARAAIAYA
ncbi:MAG: hypothetical protein ACREJN_21780 [Nitrospiraceae bacterium]